MHRGEAELRTTCGRNTIVMKILPIKIATQAQSIRNETACTIIDLTRAWEGYTNTKFSKKVFSAELRRQ